MQERCNGQDWQEKGNTETIKKRKKSDVKTNTEVGIDENW
jgi:hypothetical protein